MDPGVVVMKKVPDENLESHRECSICTLYWSKREEIGNTWTGQAQHP